MARRDHGPTAYPEFPRRATELELEILQQWRDEDLFRRTLEATEGREEFVFYEGPPTANGRPGLHHVLSRSIKDLFCRYQTMRGKHVTRIAGWDTHGLPVEIEAEKALGISGKREIEAVGVARFNEVCRESVFVYKEEWERLSERMGYWLDYSRPYITFSADYIESVWWILGQLHERGLIYRGYKSVPYCPRCGTALSSHEVALGYEEVLDPSLYFLAPVTGPRGESDPEGRAFLVWTTTPWTLPANTALAVHPALEYLEVEHDGRGLILAASRAEEVLGSGLRVRRRYMGRELIGLRYERPFDLDPSQPAAATPVTWTVVGEEFVSAEEGTGVVHLAPAFGADDFEAGVRHGLPLFQPVDDAARFKPGLGFVEGLFVKAADDLLVKDLEARGLVFRSTLEPHAYPHCWRCSSPLIYMARDSWYIRTTAVRAAMIANNRAVRWHPPEVGAGRFGEWLASNVDWALSRARYWGTPLPIWVCERDPEHWEVIGSYAELRQRAGRLPVPEGGGLDPHRPWIDELHWPCERCGGEMRRTPDVMDVWFDSGAMPYAQWHYPFENRAEWRRHFPADFICEGVDQTRGWFYSLMAISTMLGHGPPYRNVVVNDLLLDAEGQKMSKSRGNVVDPWEAIGEFGVDAIRWYFATVSQPWVPKRFDPRALRDSSRRMFDTLANTYRFFSLYANAEGWAPSAADPEPAERPVLDRWILSRLTGLVASVRAELDAYELTRAARAIGDFVVDDLSNWYVRRSRDRFYRSGDAPDTRAAFRTLYDTLVAVVGLLAPYTPFHADWLHRALRGGASVHLAPFPEPDASLRDGGLEARMEAVRVLARLGRAARERVRIRVRQPLRVAYAVLPGGGGLEAELVEVLEQELNLREVRFLQRAEEVMELRAVPDYRVLGKRFGPRTAQAAEAIRALPPERLWAWKRGAELGIVVDGEGHALTGEEFEITQAARGDLVLESDAGYALALDPTLDPSLKREGLARELVHRIQTARRQAGLAVTDRIHLGIFGVSEVVEAARLHEAFIARETLAVDVATGSTRPEGRFAFTSDVEIDGWTVHLGLAVA